MSGFQAKRQLRSTAGRILWWGLFGCVSSPTVCPEGQAVCGQACVDSLTDSRHCGACDRACAAGEVCQEGACVCRWGHDRCDGACVDVRVTSAHCGGCGQPCGNTTPYCEDGQCVAQCQKGEACGFSCVTLEDNAEHCGTCGRKCGTAQSCLRGRCAHDVVAACLSSGQLVGFQANSHFRAPAVSVGQGPAALTTWDDSLIVLDGLNQRLSLHALFDEPLTSVGRPVPTGNVPNHAVVAKSHVLVANAGSGTLQLLAQGANGLSTVAELNFGLNTYPEGVAVLGTKAYVPLYGGFGARGAAFGQRVMEVELGNFRKPEVTGSFDLKNLNLEPFEGGNPVARPFAIVAHRGRLYVALNNLDPDSYEVEGPGLLARLNPVTGEVSTVSLGQGTCLNPIWLHSDGTTLLVSCQGKVAYSGPPDYEAVSVAGAGVMWLDANDNVLSFWEARCPKDTSCPMVLPSRFAVSGSRVYVGDQNGGRLFVLEKDGQNLKEARGYFAPLPPLQACAVNATTGVSNVSDVAAIF